MKTRPVRSPRARNCGRTTCSGWVRPSRTWSGSACRPVRPGPNWHRATTNQRRTRTTTDATQRSLRGSLPPRNPDPADPSLCRVFFLPGVRIAEHFFVSLFCELIGPAGTGRGLGKCPRRRPLAVTSSFTLPKPLPAPTRLGVR
ncbi:hypothetical protein SMJ63A_180010 [Stenotrophomonas geniculata]